MKQLLFLLLLPCLALAQYTGNAGQKITLGEQTTADGLIWRGVASDTTLTVKSDTAAYFVLDTVNKKLYFYKISSTPKWNEISGSGGGSTFDTTTLNLVPRFAAKQNNITLSTTGTSGAATFSSNTLNIPNYGSALSGYLPLTGGTLTGALIGTSARFVGNLNLQATGGVRNINFFDNTNTNINAQIQYDQLTDNTGQLFFGTNNSGTFATRLTIASTGNFGIGTTSPAVQFHTTSNVRFAGLASITDLRTDADGDLFNGSDFNLKNTIDTINFGLSDVLKLKPVSFNWNDEARNINEYKSMGFIAQDIMDVIPNAASTMGDGDMQVDYNAIVATLTKAIQEQQALIKALEQRLLILENK